MTRSCVANAWQEDQRRPSATNGRQRVSAGHPLAMSGVTDPSAPLVVLLHGRGSNENDIIGRPIAESLAQTMTWIRTWLDDLAPAGRPVVLIGFSGGAAFAGGLLLHDPKRFAGADA